jgi:hypothetical protein
MALQFHPNLRNLFLGRGIAAAFTNQFSITVYSGAQPTAAQVTSNWSLFNQDTSNFLVHYTGAGWTQPSNGLLLQLTLPAAQPVVRGGTASWAILWASEVTSLQVQSTTLPSAVFIVVPCSSDVGQGVIRFANTALVEGASVAILDGSMGAYVT